MSWNYLVVVASGLVLGDIRLVILLLDRLLLILVVLILLLLLDIVLLRVLLQLLLIVLLLLHRLTNLISKLPYLFNLIFDLLRHIIIFVFYRMFFLLSQQHHLISEHLKFVNYLLVMLGRIKVLLRHSLQLFLVQPINFFLNIWIEFASLH